MSRIPPILALLLLAASLSASEAAVVAAPDFRAVVAGAADKVFPALVYIRCIRQGLEQGRKVSQEVSGSGVIVSERGEIVTNHHVIDKATEIRCLLFDGRSAHADLIGSDKDTDLALIRLRDESLHDGLPVATLAAARDMREGDFVMTMGAPWGLSRSVSIGIISSSRRYLQGHSQYSLWLQTDAAINPGNSGGPLVDTAGEVVGINTLGLTSGDNLGFAVPAATVSLIAEQLREHGAVQWSWTGLQLQPLRDFNRNITFDFDDGVIVAGTDPDSPAREAGLQSQDRIVAINGEPVTASTQEGLPAVNRLLGLLPLGQPARLSVHRRDEVLDLALTPREKGRVEGEEVDAPRWDFSAKAINQFDNPHLYFQRKEGVFVFGVKRPGNALLSGLRPLDVILKIGDDEIASLDDLRAAHVAAMAGLGERTRQVVTVLRSGLLCQFVLDYARDFERE